MKPKCAIISKPVKGCMGFCNRKKKLSNFKDARVLRVKSVANAQH